MDHLQRWLVSSWYISCFSKEKNWSLLFWCSFPELITGCYLSTSTGTLWCCWPCSLWPSSQSSRKFWRPTITVNDYFVFSICQKRISYKNECQYWFRLPKAQFRQSPPLLSLESGQLLTILGVHNRNMIVLSFRAMYWWHAWRNPIMLSSVFKLRELNCKLHGNLMPLHLESDSCDRLRVGIFLCEEMAWKTSHFCVLLWRGLWGLRGSLFPRHPLRVCTVKNSNFFFPP